MPSPRSAPRSSRQRNLSALLTQVHRAGPISRAALTEATGLNRSTIADLVAELTDAGLVNETAPLATNRVGRPSPVVTAASDVAVIAVNPEVDAIEIAAVGLDRSIQIRERIELDQLLTPEECANIVAGHVERWRGDALADVMLAGVGVAVPGLVRTKDGLVRTAPHLDWTEAPLAELVTASTGLPTVVGNDASLGARAEHLFGAAHGIDHVIYLNGGASGIGGGLIVHGLPVGGAGGYAGEFGQNRPAITRAEDHRVEGGVLEDEVNRARLLAVTGLAGADELSLARALRESTRPGIAAEITRQRRILATAVANAANALNPSVIVLGGFLATLATQDLDDFRRLVTTYTMPAIAEHLEIRTARLAEDRLLIGAAEAAYDATITELVRDR